MPWAVAGPIIGAAVTAGGAITGAELSAGASENAANKQAASAQAAIDEQKAVEKQKLDEYNTAMAQWQKQWQAYQQTRLGLLSRYGVPVNASTLSELSSPGSIPSGVASAPTPGLAAPSTASAATPVVAPGGPGAVKADSAPGLGSVWSQWGQTAPAVVPNPTPGMTSLADLLPKAA